MVARVKRPLMRPTARQGQGGRWRRREEEEEAECREKFADLLRYYASSDRPGWGGGEVWGKANAEICAREGRWTCFVARRVKARPERARARARARETHRRVHSHEKRRSGRARVDLSILRERTDPGSSERERERERTQPAFLGDRSDDEISDGSYDVVISRDSQIHTTLGPGSSDLAFDCVTRLL